MFERMKIAPSLWISKLTSVTCDRCGHQFEVETRAPIGEGTRAAERKKKLNQNELAIGKILCESEQPLTVRQVQGILYERNIRRQRRREKVPGGAWNYHNVQIVLSMLLGAKLISATRSKEFVDEDGYYYDRPTPRYFVPMERRERLREIQSKQGQISLSLVRLHRKCPRCGAIV